MVEFEGVLERALGLPENERASLAHELLASLPDGFDSDVETAWEAEIAARVESFDNGQAVTVPAPEVFARAQEILRAARG